MNKLISVVSWVAVFLLWNGVLSAADRPNILFILVDDMGWRDLACYGNPIHETPHIDKLASQGMRFTNGYAACPICGPSRAAIMTGKSPSRTGFVDNFITQVVGGKMSRAKGNQFMKLEEWTLAEALHAGGYQTGFLGKWHLSASNEIRLPTDQGFDVNIAGCLWGHPVNGYFAPYGIPAPGFKEGPEGEYLTDRLTTEAIHVLDDFSQKDKPWLLYMSYYTVHAPFNSKEEKTRKYEEKARQAGVKNLNATYAGMVESFDENVGRLLQWLDDHELREKTIVVLTLRGYKGELYEGGIREPFIIRWPGVTKPGSKCDSPVQGVDFYATLLEMVDLPENPEQHIDSTSLVPLLKGETVFDHGPLIWHFPVAVPHMPYSEPGSAIRDGDWKYLQFYNDGRRELYNLKDDIGETKNLISAMPEKVAEMKAQLDAMLKAHNAAIPIDLPAKP
jgi:arylsulfatase A